MKTMLILVIQLKNAVVPNAVAPNPVAPRCQNIHVVAWKNISKEVREYLSMKGLKSARIMMAILQLPSDSLRTKAENFLNISSFESIFLVNKLLENGLFIPLRPFHRKYFLLYMCSVW